MHNYLILLALPLFMAACAGEPGSAEALPGESPSSVAAEVQRPALYRLNSTEAKGLLDQGGITVLDIRTPQEWAGGRVKGAQLLDYYSADFTQKLQALDRTQPYLLYCAVGGRSQDAARLMQQLGFQQVYDATEGFAALKRAGVPVE